MVGSPRRLLQLTGSGIVDQALCDPVAEETGQCGG
jgi:hypothetical protein